MTVTVKELHEWLTKIIEKGDGEKTVKLSVTYHNCDHIQKLEELSDYPGMDWITLHGEM